MSKFKVGQTIVPKQYHQGFEKATIYKIDDKNYHCHIMCGIALIPIHAVETNYTLKTDK